MTSTLANNNMATSFKIVFIIIQQVTKYIKNNGKYKCENGTENELLIIFPFHGNNYLNT